MLPMIKETDSHLENERDEPESIQSSTFKPIKVDREYCR